MDNRTAYIRAKSTLFLSILKLSSELLPWSNRHYVVKEGRGYAFAFALQVYVGRAQTSVEPNFISYPRTVENMSSGTVTTRGVLCKRLRDLIDQACELTRRPPNSPDLLRRFQRI